MEANQNNKALAINRALAMIDAIMNPVALDKDLTDPPSNPAQGDAYIIASPSNNAWYQQEGNFAYVSGGVWGFIKPPKGMVVYVEDESTYYMYNGSAWVIK